MGSKQCARQLVPKDHLVMIDKVFEEFGVTEWQIEQKSKHPRVVFKLGDRVLKFSLPSSPSDRKGILCSRTKLRKLCRQQLGPAEATLSSVASGAVGPSVSLQASHRKPTN